MVRGHPGAVKEGVAFIEQHRRNGVATWADALIVKCVHGVTTRSVAIVHSHTVMASGGCGW